MVGLIPQLLQSTLFDTELHQYFLLSILPLASFLILLII